MKAWGEDGVSILLNAPDHVRDITNGIGGGFFACERNERLETLVNAMNVFSGGVFPPPMSFHSTLHDAIAAAAYFPEWNSNKDNV